MVPPLPRVLALLVLLPSEAIAAGRILLTTDEVTRVWLDGTYTSTVLANQETAVKAGSGGAHVLRLTSTADVVLWEGQVEIPLEADLVALWQGGAFTSAEAEPDAALAAKATATARKNASSASSTSSSSRSRSSTSTDHSASAYLKGRASQAVSNTGSRVAESARTVTQTASVAFPQTSGVATATSVASSPLVTTVGSEGVSIAKEAWQDQANGEGTLSTPTRAAPMSRMAGDGDPASATTNQAPPPAEAPVATEGLIPVTFSTRAGLEAIVIVDGGLTVRLVGGVNRQVAHVPPGLHNVSILNAATSAPLYRGHLEARDGDVLEVGFSSTQPPICNLPARWW